MATLKKMRKPLSRLLLRPPSARASEGLQNLRDVMTGVARLSRVEPVPKQYKVVVNWGNTAGIRLEAPARVLNQPLAIAKAVDKIVAFRTMKEADVRVPEFTQEKPTVGKGAIWFARTVLRGSGGEGIVAIRPGDSVPDAPLYVQYIQKLVEFRLHVVAGKVIFAQQKRRKTEAEQDKDQKLIRNHANGWVFCPVSLDEVSEDAKDVAVRGVASLGLDFGAVDLVIGKRDNLAYVLEVNTAPGLQSEGLINAYATAFTSFVSGS
jgi:glutathione synthase/RimK-type ligase-like ATP-grasp enzyme